VVELAAAPQFRERLRLDMSRQAVRGKHAVNLAHILPDPFHDLLVAFLEPEC
jgi:hypothetical protein